MRRLVTLVLVALFSTASSAQSIRERVQKGYSLLKKGDPAAAMADFHDAETDAPDSDIVHYAMAHAKYEQGLQDLEGQAVEDGLILLSEAREAFLGLRNSTDAFVRRNFDYNAANCSAHIAKNSAAMGDREQTIEAFEDSIMAYEDVLSRYPDHEGARRNLDHMRFLLKSMLQNPPPAQEGEGGDSENQDEGDEEEKDEDGQQSQEGDPQEEQEQEDGSNQPPEGSENQEPPPSGGEEEQNEPEPLNRDNIEAILESLEDQARKEQENMRKAKTPPRIMRGKWW